LHSAAFSATVGEKSLFAEIHQVKTQIEKKSMLAITLSFDIHANPNEPKDAHAKTTSGEIVETYFW
jgi:hypothetical protein